LWRKRCVEVDGVLKQNQVCLHCNKQLITSQRKYCGWKCSTEFRNLTKFNSIDETKNVDGKFGMVAMKFYLRKKFSNTCMKCGGTEWFGNPIPLEMHHINGISKDNSVENLMMICPNCHTFTNTYKSKNKTPDRSYRKKYYTPVNGFD
jgi:5-methylcytosine-specific restriction endonuclease McrA